MTLKLNTIIRNTDKERKNRSKQLVVKLETVQKFESINGYRMDFHFRVNSQANPGKSYKVVFRSLSRPLITNENWNTISKGTFPMTVNCECPDFKYRWEVVLWKSDAARKLESDGSLPDITNPKHITAMCKHALAAFKYLQSYAPRTPFDRIGIVKRR